MNHGEEISLIGGVLIGSLLSALVTFFLMINIVGITSDSIRKCERACKNNNGCQVIYLDGDIECKDGAEFNEE